VLVAPATDRKLLDIERLLHVAVVVDDLNQVLLTHDEAALFEINELRKTLLLG
jgi:hypothetical protein